MAPRKSKKLEKLGVSKVVLHISPDASVNHDHVTMRFEFGEYSSNNVELKWSRTRLDYHLSDYTRSIDSRAYSILEMRRAFDVPHMRQYLDIGLAAYGTPFACRLDEPKVDGQHDIARVVGILDWLKATESNGAYIDVLNAVLAESVPFEARYRFDRDKDKWVTWIDWEDSGWAKTWAFVYSAESERVLAEHYAARAKRLAEEAERRENEQQEAV